MENQNQEIAVRDSTPRSIELMEMTVDSVLAQAIKVQEVMRAVMKEGVHFGVIPGTDKPTLYKAGAEKLCFVFRLAPSFEIIREDLPGNHREYIIKCTLTHIPTGRVMAQGVGSCSTMEKKYRYRLGEAESTGHVVPKAYWDMRSKDPAKAQEILGKGMVTKKIDNVWYICKKSEEHTENPDIADSYNTVLKMGKKRSFVDTCITAVAASDCLTQDLEEMEEFADKIRKPGETQEATTPPAAAQSTKAQSPQPAQSQQKPAATPPPQQREQRQGSLSYSVQLWDAVKAQCQGDNMSAGKLLKELTGESFYTKLTEPLAIEGLKKFQERFQGTPVHEDAQVS